MQPSMLLGLNVYIIVYMIFTKVLLNIALTKEKQEV